MKLALLGHEAAGNYTNNYFIHLLLLLSSDKLSPKHQKINLKIQTGSRAEFFIFALIEKGEAKEWLPYSVGTPCPLSSCLRKGNTLPKC